ncbi:MAG: PilZ domain-containing protein [Firmicutes bacterium]|nr:PilZ domain-containing protein [Bacillota bacterium]
MRNVSLEKRKFLRLEINKKATCKFLGGDGTRFNLLAMLEVDTQIVNLSVSGACVAYECSISAGAVQKNGIVLLEIPFEEEPFSVNGRVAWCEKTETGIKAGLQFEVVDEEDRQKLLRFLNGELRFAKA